MHGSRDAVFQGSHITVPQFSHLCNGYDSSPYFFHCYEHTVGSQNMLAPLCAILEGRARFFLWGPWGGAGSLSI